MGICSSPLYLTYMGLSLAINSAKRDSVKIKVKIIRDQKALLLALKLRHLLFVIRVPIKCYPTLISKSMRGSMKTYIKSEIIPTTKPISPKIKRVPNITG